MLITFCCFVVGFLLVAATISVIHCVTHHETSLGSRRAAIMEITHRPTRLEAARTELARTRAELKIILRELTKFRQRLADWLPLEDTPGSAWRFFLVAGVLGMLEAILFLLYSLGSGFGSAPAWLLALLSGPAAFVAILLVHVGLAAAFGSRHRPARTLYRARIGLVVGILAVILAVWAVLGGRNLTDVRAIETLTAVGLVALTSVTSMAGGFAALVATTLLEERQLERAIVTLEEREQALEEHYTVIENDVARLEDTSNTQRSSGSFAAPAAVVPVLALALLLTPKSGTAQNAPAATFVRTAACEVLVDLTTSVNPLARQNALNLTRGNLQPMADALGCSILRIVPFSGNLMDDITEVSLPAIIDPVTACHDVKPPLASGVKGATAILYPSVQREWREEVRKTCESKLSEQQQQELYTRTQAFSEAANALERAATLRPHGNCTALNLAVRRALQRAQHVVTITDGVNTCPSPSRHAKVEDGTTMLFLIVASNSDSPDAPQEVFTRLEAIQRAFPGGRALLLPELTPSFWRSTVQ
jgi:hypothetical protein